MTMSAARETVLYTLLDKVGSVQFTSPLSSGATQFVSISRRLKLWTDVSRDQRPALFMTCHGESPTYRAENVPAYNKLSVRLFVYLDASDENTIGDTDISIILDSIDAALSPGPGEQRQTLGNLVSHCRVDGEILRDPGDIDGDGMIIIPISVALT